MKSALIHASGLRCRLLSFGERGHDAGPKVIVLLCHGYGAGGDDLVSLAPYIMNGLEGTLGSKGEGQGDGKGEVLFAFPEAPIDLAPLGMPGGRAWFPIDVNRLMNNTSSQNQAFYASHEPPLMGEALEKLQGLVKELSESQKTSIENFILGGFSQGAMMAIALGMAAEKSPLALWAWSPTLVDEASLRKNMKQHQGLSVYLSHGKSDPILPFPVTERLVALMREEGLKVEFQPFRGGHTVPEEALAYAKGAISTMSQKI